MGNYNHSNFETQTCAAANNSTVANNAIMRSQSIPMANSSNLKGGTNHHGITACILIQSRLHIQLSVVHVHPSPGCAVPANGLAQWQDCMLITLGIGKPCLKKKRIEAGHLISLRSLNYLQILGNSATHHCWILCAQHREQGAWEVFCGRGH